MTSGTLSQRIVPPLPRAGRNAHRVVERNLLVYRRAWMIIFSGFFEPVFYLFSIGVGLGQLVGNISTGGGAPVTFAEYVAPGLLAASAMNGAVFESTMNIFFKLKYGRIYDAMLATPLSPSDVAIGEVTWSQLRGLLYAFGFAIVMLVMGLMPSWWGLLAIPAALLIGLGFAGVGMAVTTFMRSWQDFDMVTLATLPLFLFSTTFYPLTVYPGWLQNVVRISPLYHGVELIRGLTLGIVDWTLLGHAAFLACMGLIGMYVASRRIEKLLLN